MQGAGAQLAKNGRAAPDALDPLAKRLFTTLTDGSPYPLRWNVRHGYRLRDAATGRPVVSSFTDEWRPARDLHADGLEVDRRANAFVLAQHLRGRFDVAIQSPSWSSILVLDIDRHLAPPAGAEEGFEAELRANLQRDDVLAAVWRAYGFCAERQPVILATPGGGYHVYMPLDRAWPLAWARQWHEHHLNRRGLGLEPGVLELYPSGVPLRAPCGRGSMLVVPQNPDDPDNLALEPQCVLRRKGRLIRDVVPYVEGFLGRLEAARRPLEQWLAESAPDPAWDATWGPFGRREKNDAPITGEGALYPHKVESQEAGGASPPPAPGFSFSSSPAQASAGTPRTSGFLLFGRAFREKVTSLTVDGIASSRERHDAALKMTWYHYVVRGSGRDETLHDVEAWLRSGTHVVKPGREARWIKTTLREAKHYLERLMRSGRAKPAGGVARPRMGRVGLVDADDTVVRATPPGVAREIRAILTYLTTFADDAGRVPHAVILSRRLLENLCGQRRIREDNARRRATVVAVEALEELGILAVHTDYSVGRHGRRYTVWYEFGSGRLPERSADGELVLARREVEEGELAAVVTVVGEPPVGRFASLRGTVAAAANAWWQRMYARRAFTPAEFFEADRRRVLPGPFRDRRVEPRKRPAEGVIIALHRDQAHARTCFCDACISRSAAPSLAEVVGVPIDTLIEATGPPESSQAPPHARPCVCADCFPKLFDA